MRDNKLRTITLALSLMLMASAFIVGCAAPQERPTPDRYGTRYYMENDRYTTRNGRNNNTNYGVTDNPRNAADYGVNTTPNNRLYGFFDTGNESRRFGGYNNLPQGMNMASKTASNSNEVSRMENSCNNISGVKDTTIVKNGDTAYVACDTDGADNQNVAALRTECANRIRNIDPSIKKVVVTVDPNKVSRLRNMIQDINIGRPARGFMNDLENLFR